MTGFYNKGDAYVVQADTIALPEMTGFYNGKELLEHNPLTIALPEMTGFYNCCWAHLPGR